MAYQVYITDNINTVELDSENIDAKSIFQNLDLNNIGARKDNIKNIKFKGTKINNNIFGSFFDLGRTSDLNNPNNLFFNYNPLKTATAYVYEDSNLIFKGTLRIVSIEVDNTSNIIYDTIITGSFIDLKTSLQGLYLSDLDFSDLTHRYSIPNIINSWSGSTERFDSTSFYSEPFEFGSGYVYPNIDYGYKFTTTPSTPYTANNVNAGNFKPAMYLRTYIDKIFNQPVMTGYTYEIKGSPDFVDMFNHIIIPDSQKGNNRLTANETTTYSTPASQTGSTNIFHGYELADVSQIVQPVNAKQKLLDTPNYPNVLEVQRDFKTTARVKVSMSTYGATTSYINSIFTIILAKRPSENNNHYFAGGGTNWITLSESSGLIVSGHTTFSNVEFETNIGLTEFKVGEQVGVVVVGTGAGTDFTVDSCVLTIPDSGDTITYELSPSLYTIGADTLTPQAPAQIKQIDFLKSVITQFNFMLYADKTNNKHIVFEKYDDYYSLCSPLYIKDNALDWSNKIDYSKGFKIKSNLDLPSSYDFTYKNDVDFLCKYYTITFNKVYGEFIFNDSLGLTQEKKVELIFAPLIVQQQPLQSDRIYPLLYQCDSNVIETIKTVPRMGYYNGLQPCNVPYNINYVTGTTFNTWFTGYVYPQISNYYITTGGTVTNLHFAEPAQTYFTQSSDFSHSTTSYEDYYINQISDLTNPDVTYIECQAYLNEIDISNLDLKVPVYINTGTLNGAYFKVLKVEYDGNKSVSKLQLQKITF